MGSVGYGGFMSRVAVDNRISILEWEIILLLTSRDPVSVGLFAPVARVFTLARESLHCK